MQFYFTSRSASRARMCLPFAALRSQTGVWERGSIGDMQSNLEGACVRRVRFPGSPVDEFDRCVARLNRLEAPSMNAAGAGARAARFESVLRQPQRRAPSDWACQRKPVVGFSSRRSSTVSPTARETSCPAWLSLRHRIGSVLRQEAASPLLYDAKLNKPINSIERPSIASFDLCTAPPAL